MSLLIHERTSSKAKRQTGQYCQFVRGGLGVPVARVQKTTIRTFAVNSEEENEGLRPHISGTKTPDALIGIRGLMKRVAQ